MIGFNGKLEDKPKETNEVAMFIAALEPSLRNIAKDLSCTGISLVDLSDKPEDPAVADVFGMCIAQYLTSFNGELAKHMKLPQDKKIAHANNIKLIVSSIVKHL